MARVKNSQYALEALVQADDAPRVSQYVVEALIPFPSNAISPQSVSGAAVVFPGLDSASLGWVTASRRNILKLITPKAGNVVFHLTSVLNDGGNIGVCRFDGTDDHFQSAPTVGTYTWAVTGGAPYLVYSWLSSTYRAGLTGAGNIDYTDAVTGAAVSQAALEALVSGVEVTARVSQYVVEVLRQEADTTPSGGGGGGGGTVSFGYAS